VGAQTGVPPRRLNTAGRAIVILLIEHKEFSGDDSLSLRISHLTAMRRRKADSDPQGRVKVIPLSAQKIAWCRLPAVKKIN
jgi:hypothetical protein